MNHDNKFEILTSEGWQKVKIGEPQVSGWLRYELPDGTVGLTPPSKWRTLEAK